jgi:hypothetical protein
MTTHDPAAVISRVLAGFLVPGRSYPSPLPGDLAAWHCYTVDGGHSIVVVVALQGDGPPTEDLLVPAPVRAVLRAGWTVVDGYIVCELPYDPRRGLLIQEDMEFDADHSPHEASHHHVVTVGRPYNPRIVDWPDGIGQLRLTAQGAEFLLPLRKPTSHEVEAFSRGTAEFALLPQDRFLILLYRFGHDGDPRHGIPWSDAVWEYHRQTEDPVAVPGAPGTNFPLRLIMVDAGGGIVAAQRMLAVPHQFADDLRAAVHRQQNTPSHLDALGEIQDLYKRYTTTDLLPHATARFLFPSG